jgi:CheY-like chemotaxis protein
MQNIIINARQAMENSGKITIFIKNISKNEAEKLNIKRCKYVLIKIQDYGPGISRENISEIFDPYYSTKRSGSGLGLATSFSIIDKHDGAIKVDSKFGEGTSFSIYLPAAEKDDSRDNPMQKSSMNIEKMQRNTVLIMDDEPFIRRLLSSMLEKFGYGLIQASDGEEAIAMYRRAVNDGITIDLVMLDLTIPGGMGGEEAAKGILEIDKSQKIVAISGYSENPVLANYRQYGFINAIAKPFTAKQLNKVLQQVHG